MPFLTDQIKASGLSLNDFVHISKPVSYKATIAQLIDANNCCLQSGIYVSSASTLNLYGLSGSIELSVSGLTTFSGGSSDCINNFYTNNIHPCNTNILVQPAATNGNFTYFGTNNASSGFTIQQLIHPAGTAGACSPSITFGYTRIKLNTLSFNTIASFEFRSFNQKGSYMFYDRICAAGGTFATFRDFYQGLLYIATALPSSNPTVDNTIGTSYLWNCSNQVGLVLGSLNTNDSTNGQYGESKDTFISTSYSANGINFVSTNSDNTNGYIRFYLGTDYGIQTDDPNIHINGSGSTKGFIGIGRTNINPTSLVDIRPVNTSTSGFNYEQLRLRTSYTPTGGTDTNGGVGEFAWDENYLYIKSSVSPHTWERMALFSF